MCLNEGLLPNYTHIQTHTYIYKYKVGDLIEGDPNAPFLIATTQGVEEGATPFP